MSQCRLKVMKQQQEIEGSELSAESFQQEEWNGSEKNLLKCQVKASRWLWFDFKSTDFEKETQNKDKINFLASLKPALVSSWKWKFYCFAGASPSPDNCWRRNKTLCRIQQSERRGRESLYESIRKKGEDFADGKWSLNWNHSLPSILIIAFRDCVCFDSPCIDPCWTPGKRKNS